MNMPDPRPDLTYLLYWDDDSIPLEAGITIGSHIDNDIVVGGEDILDYHVRVELSERGPVLVPLDNGSIGINGISSQTPVQVIIGDIIVIGHAVMQLGIEIELESEAQQWTLYAEDGGPSYPLSGEVSIGRGEQAAIRLYDEHISRHHARILERRGYLWVQDLGSANGTYINDRPLLGGARLFHGDTITFDKVRYQVVATGPELTPAKSYDEPLLPTHTKHPSPALDDTRTSRQQGVSTDTVNLPEVTEPGVYLLSLNVEDPLPIRRLAVGENTIGRAESCNVVIDHSTVSAEHAQIVVRPERAVITNLMATNGTIVNGQNIDTVELKDMDTLSFGDHGFVYREVVEQSQPFWRETRTWTTGGIILALIVLLTLLL